MKFFTRRKSKEIRQAAFGSALIVVSAFALFFTSPLKAEEKNDSAHLQVTDSMFTARYVFENLHTSDLEILNQSVRLDMLDYWDVDSVYKASNAMEGLSWLEAVSPSYLKVRITSVSTLEIKILPVKKGKLAMTVYTVGDDVQAQDSNLKFYDENLSQLETSKFYTMPPVKDFFEIPKGSTTKMKEIEEMIPFPTIAVSANPDNDNLEVRLTVEQYINQDDWNIAKLFLKPSVKLEWKHDKYRLLQ